MKMFFSKLWAMLKSNWAIKIVALLFAFVIWSYVMASTNPARSKIVEAVPLTITNSSELQAKGLVINEEESSLPASVSVTVQAGIDSHSSIGVGTVRASVNLADISHTGKVEVLINGSCSVSGATVKNVSPGKLTLSVDELVTREIPVIARLTGERVEGYYVGEPSLSSDYVTVKGAKSVVERIIRSECEIDISDLVENVKASYVLTLLDAAGEKVDPSLLLGTLPSVIVDMEVMPTKKVPVDEQSVIDAVTNIKAGYEVTGVVIEPAEIEIAAEQSVLSKIDLVRVQSISADDADKSVTLDAYIQPLENITYQSANVVQVLVKISEVQAEKTFRNQRISIQNVEEGLSARVLSEKYTDITIKGGQSIVREISQDDLMPYIDLAGLGAGTHTCILEMTELQGISVEDVTMSVAEVKVIIK